MGNTLEEIESTRNRLQRNAEVKPRLKRSQKASHIWCARPGWAKNRRHLSEFETLRLVTIDLHLPTNRG